MMKKKIFRYLKHVVFTVLICVVLFAIFGYFSGFYIKYDRNNLVDNWENDGPYVFIENDSLSINYIKGDKKNGFYKKQNNFDLDTTITLKSFYNLDSTNFNFELNTNFLTAKSTYNDNSKILAVSDLESNYKTFRDFLINNKVIDKNLEWIFEKNHLVLVGDFIDRSYYSTQILWFIYSLEQKAKAKGGFVHFILGNHEIMNMKGNHKYARSKYNVVSAILNKKQFQLYDKNAVLGKWMASKNTLEIINGNLFVHGGIHPDISKIELSIEEINNFIRKNYYKTHYPKKGESKLATLLLSSKTSPFWYRGYYINTITQEQVQRGLDKFNAKAVIVGHNIQPKVNRTFNGKVIGIDVKHPQDYYKYFPNRKSEGLLIEGENYFRIFNNGEKEKI